MSVQCYTEGNNVFIALIDTVSVEDARQYLVYRAKAYAEIGEATGLIFDIRELRKFTIGGMRISQQHIRKNRTKIPIAFVGHPDSLIYMFLQTLLTLGGSGEGQSVFVNDVDTAKQWVDEWFVRNGRDREALRGVVVDTLSFAEDYEGDDNK